MPRWFPVFAVIAALLCGAQTQARGLVVEAFPDDAHTVFAAYSEDGVALRFSLRRNKVFLIASDTAMDLHPSTEMQSIEQDFMQLRLIGNGVFVMNCLLECQLSARAVGSSAVYITLDHMRPSPKLIDTTGLEERAASCCANHEHEVEDPRSARLNGGHVRIQGSRLQTNLRDPKAILSEYLISRRDCIYPTQHPVERVKAAETGNLLLGQSWCRSVLTDIASIAERIVFGVNLDAEVAQLHLIGERQHQALVAEVRRLASAPRDHYAEVVRKLLDAPLEGPLLYYNDPLTSLLSAEARDRPPYSEEIFDYIDLLTFERRNEAYAYQLVTAYMKDMVEGAEFDRLRKMVNSARVGDAFAKRLEEAFVLTSFRHASLEDFLSLIFSLEAAEYQARTRQVGAERLISAGFADAARDWSGEEADPATSPLTAIH